MDIFIPGDYSYGINVSLRSLLKRLSNTSVANASPIILLKYCGITGPTHTELSPKNVTRTFQVEIFSPTALTCSRRTWQSRLMPASTPWPTWAWLWASFCRWSICTPKYRFAQNSNRKYHLLGRWMNEFVRPKGPAWLTKLFTFGIYTLHFLSNPRPRPNPYCCVPQIAWLISQSYLIQYVIIRVRPSSFCRLFSSSAIEGMLLFGNISVIAGHRICLWQLKLWRQDWCMVEAGWKRLK